MANLSFVKLFEIPLSPLEVQRVIVDKIEVERKVIDSCCKFIKTYEEKIKRVISRVWHEQMRHTTTQMGISLILR